jgi:hypothetical protein
MYTSTGLAFSAYIGTDCIESFETPVSFSSSTIPLRIGPTSCHLHAYAILKFDRV